MLTNSIEFEKKLEGNPKATMGLAAFLYEAFQIKKLSKIVGRN